MPTATLTGAELAGYRIEAVAGRGGMGVVYRAWHLGLERPVALKVISPDLASREEFRARFQRESRLAAALDHPHVLPLYEAGEHDGVLFIAMRWVDGTDLGRLLSDDAPTGLPVDRALGLVEHVAGALDAAHARGLVHRDVKPGNVLLATEGDAPEHAYLADFGLAKRDGTGGITETGRWLGTADYASPEQIEGGQVGPGADVYALGCVLYAALTGHAPFVRENAVGVAYAHIHDPAPRPSAERPALPPTLDGVVARALAKRPSDRFASATALAAAARRAADGGGANAAATRPRRRHEWKLGAPESSSASPERLGPETVIRPEAVRPPAAPRSPESQDAVDPPGVAARSPESEDGVRRRAAAARSPESRDAPILRRRPRLATDATLATRPLGPRAADQTLATRPLPAHAAAGSPPLPRADADAGSPPPRAPRRPRVAQPPPKRRRRGVRRVLGVLVVLTLLLAAGAAVAVAAGIVHLPSFVRQAVGDVRPTRADPSGPIVRCDSSRCTQGDALVTAPVEGENCTRASRPGTWTRLEAPGHGPMAACVIDESAGPLVAIHPPVPDLAGARLDLAEQLLDRSGIPWESEGGGLLGVVLPRQWTVCRTTPRPGATLPTDVPVTLSVGRDC